MSLIKLASQRSLEKKNTIKNRSLVINFVNKNNTFKAYSYITSRQESLFSSFQEKHLTKLHFFVPQKIIFLYNNNINNSTKLIKKVNVTCSALIIVLSHCR